MPESINNWADLASLLESHSDGTWIFRGEPEPDNILRPKAGRLGKGPGNTRKPAYHPDDERRALELFQRQAHPHLRHTPSSDLEWLAVAQHHGMSTRLLDWTESLLVAAYFATVKAGTSGHANVYGVAELRSITKTEEKTPFKIKQPGVYRPPHLSSRIPAQRSVFTVHPDPTAPFTPPSLFHWTITDRACSTIKRILDSCAINESSLFPDLDGLSRYIGWRYKWGKL